MHLIVRPRHHALIPCISPYVRMFPSFGRERLRAPKDTNDCLLDSKALSECCVSSPEVFPQLFWQFGERHYRSKHWSEAADWFLAGTHNSFRSMSHISDPKCLRKAALCYVQCGEHAQASAVLRRCPPSDAPTYYVALLVATHQGEGLVDYLLLSS